MVLGYFSFVSKYCFIIGEKSAMLPYQPFPRSLFRGRACCRPAVVSLSRPLVAAGAGGAVAAAGSGVVIAGLRVLAVGAQADDAGDALQQGVELVFGVVVA